MAKNGNSLLGTYYNGDYKLQAKKYRQSDGIISIMTYRDLQNKSTNDC